MESNTHRIGWIGLGRMGYPMVERLVKRGHVVEVWNRTRAKAEPLGAKGAKIAERLSDLADVDILFTMVSTGADLDAVVFGADGVLNGSGPAPRIMSIARASAPTNPTPSAASWRPAT
jgi:3-hydroxyisobutyrate dehydrogenase